MTRRRVRLTLVVAAIIYLAFGVRGWLGVEESNIRNQDETYWAAIYARSNVFVPFMKTHKVLVPSARDLNSHTVFETYGFWQRVDINWVDSQNLQVICSRCSQTKLSSDKVDNITIQLRKQ